jgi:hypothetical protein
LFGLDNRFAHSLAGPNDRFFRTGDRLANDFLNFAAQCSWGFLVAPFLLAAVFAVPALEAPFLLAPDLAAPGLAADFFEAACVLPAFWLAALPALELAAFCGAAFELPLD